MPNVARLSDSFAGICIHPSHIIPIGMAGTITSASTDSNANKLGIAREGDTVTGACGHSGTIIGISKNNTNKRKIARIGDPVAGFLIGVLVSGSPNVFSR